MSPITVQRLRAIYATDAAGALKHPAIGLGERASLEVIQLGVKQILDVPLEQRRPIPAEEAVERALGQPGEYGRGRPKDRDSNTTSIGRGAAYTLARLDRDRTDLAAKVRAGKLSAHRAAREDASMEVWPILGKPAEGIGAAPINRSIATLATGAPFRFAHVGSPSVPPLAGETRGGARPPQC